MKPEADSPVRDGIIVKPLATYRRAPEGRSCGRPLCRSGTEL